MPYSQRSFSVLKFLSDLYLNIRIKIGETVAHPEGTLVILH